MSHEIKTLLNTITSAAGSAKNFITDNDKHLASINQVLDSSRHLQGILNDISDLSKIDIDKLELVNDPFSFIIAYEEVSGIIGQRCLDRKINFITNMDEIKDTILLGDKLRLNQVLINLLGNAVKFTSEGGEIKFTVHVLEETVKKIKIRFHITDTGIGIPEDQIKRLFIPFEQADTKALAKYGGAGLGLSMSQSIINMMGGVIDVKSAPNTGSEFTFDLSFGKGEK
jgi:signal transduction histidine kinase